MAGLLYYTLGLNGRRYLQICLTDNDNRMLARLFSYDQTTQITLAGIFLMLLIVDYMFLDEPQFKFDPDYANWARQTTPAHF
ncbi:Hypothetical Protein FCC1311_005772 [Hondaea fermentalgiana]|uniref:Uncharacterized protein n=1 Tax=Hondaea fermentalgiana TaxID=2315210 RepID=A0A2R5G221_9STRA|nr:Hypothetical Protein FCC1311_005772 [Hondaea fermentalgiana]|eukprot:GBG24359.1 Hypothetical Protein FCC1311_005772 [Hondaea fermentalgiana]